jgi:tryptophanyl-tRNA synthetase
MSSSNPNSAIFMSDTPNEIKKKINRHAFSGGQETAELQRELGANPDIDVSYTYLTYFEDDDEKLKHIYDDYKSGKLMTGDLKKECIAIVQKYVKAFQEARSKATDEVMKEYMTPRKLEWKGNPNAKRPEPKEKAKEVGKDSVDENQGPSKASLKKAAKKAAADKAKAEKAAKGGE